MKILVITVYNSFNFGAFLQAFAMYKYLTNQGHKVDFLCMEKHDFVFHKNYYKTKNPIRFFKRFITEKSFNKDIKLINSIDSVESSYDLAIIGSDELWNVVNNGFEHKPEYIGYNISAKNIITYAVSCNRTTVKDFNMHYKYDDVFSKLTAISVRDRMTEKLVKELASNINPIKVLDPTFLYDFSVNRNRINKKYVLLYGYSFLDDEVVKIKEYSRKMNLPIYSVGFEHKWCDKYINCGPIEFLDYIYSSDAVITATFHGSVFSIIFEKPFASFGRDNLKVLDLLDTFELDDKNASRYGISEILSSKFDWVNVKNIRNDKKLISENFLKEYIC